MKRKTLSLLLAVCCMLSVVMPISAWADNAAAVEFFDDFETDNVGTAPAKWQTVNNGFAPTISVAEEGGNHFLRITATKGGDTIKTRPTVQTKDGLLNLKLQNATQKIVIEAKMRTQNSGMRKSLRLGYTDNDWDASQYNLIMFRNAAGNFAYLNGNHFDGKDTQTKMDVLSGFANDPTAWYAVKAVIDPATKEIAYTLTKVGTEETYTAMGKMDSPEYNALEIISSLNLRFVTSVEGEVMDIDDVKAYYRPEAEVPTFFSDNFEEEAVGSTLQNWVDRTGNADLRVAEENGNRFAHISWTETANSLPIVSTRDDSFSVALNRTESRRVVVEARMRMNNTNYRDYLRINFPKAPSTPDHNGNRYSLWWANPNNANYYFNYLKSETFKDDATWHQPDFTSKPAGECPAVGEWFTYRAVIDTATGKVRHEINGSHKADGEMEAQEFQKMNAITALVFTYRTAGGAFDQVSGAGSMDFDDVKLYDFAEDSAEVTYLQNGTELTKTAAGAVQARVHIKNFTNTDVSAYYIYTVLCEGDKILDARAAERKFTSVSTVAEMTVDAPTVTDPTRQSLKTFVWKAGMQPLRAAAVLPCAK